MDAYLRVAFLCALAVRICTSFLPHSGQGRPPMYGDYEAQRHWMEVTWNLPVHEWYTATERNDLLYWGLDYPPLTAFSSQWFGAIASLVYPPLVQWHSSRGNEAWQGKVYMRATVIVADLLIFFTSVAWYVHSQRCRGAAWRASVMYLLFSPALILMDHAHFQYNCVTLGLMLAALTASTVGAHLLAAALFSLCLNYKQMSLYWAPAVFVYLLMQCWEGTVVGWDTTHGSRLLRAANQVILLGSVVATVFVTNWLPFCVVSSHSSVGCVAGLTAVLQRLFPVTRGLFEDKVANFWCVFEPLFRMRKSLFGKAVGSEHERVLLLCTAVTFMFMLPGLLGLWRRGSRGDKADRGYKLALFTTALSFFLASYQVHEKSILLPLLPLCTLADDLPILSHMFAITAAWSMWPLYALDRTLPAACALIVLFVLISTPWSWQEASTGLFQPRIDAIRPEEMWLARVLRCRVQLARAVWVLATLLLYVVLAALSVAALLVPAPSSLPDLHPYLSAVASAAVFTFTWAIGTALLWAD